MRRALLISLSTLALAACASQEPAMVELRGDEFFGKNSFERAYGFSPNGAAKMAYEPAVEAAPSGSIHVRELEGKTIAAAPVPQPTAPQPMAAISPISATSNTPLQPIPALASKPASKDQANSIHVVQQGETLYRLSKHYQLSVDQLMAANGMTSPSDLKIGHAITIPGTAGTTSNTPAIVAAPPQPVITAPETKTVMVSQKMVTKTAQVPSQPEFIWPVKGDVISSTDTKLYSDGVNIRAKEGTPIAAAAQGTVVHAGSQLEGYGNLIIVRHSGNWFSAYAHTQNIRVKKGDSVKQGETIAMVGKTGHVSEPQLHFSLREGKTARDPIALMGKPAPLQVAAQ